MLAFMTFLPKTICLLLLVIKTAVTVRMKVISLMTHHQTAVVTHLVRAVVPLRTAAVEAAAVQRSLIVTRNQSKRKRKRRADETPERTTFKLCKAVTNHNIWFYHAESALLGHFVILLTGYVRQR